MINSALGQKIREARAGRNLSLRELSRQLEVTPSYVHDIELGRRLPSERVLMQLCAVLDLDFDELMALGGRFGEVAETYMRRHPQAVRLLRRIAERDLSPEQLQELEKLVA